MKEKFLFKLEEIYRRYCELSEKLSDPAVISDTAEWTKLAKDQSEITEISQKYEEYTAVIKQLEDAAGAAKTETDKDMKELMLAEAEELGIRSEELKNELKLALLPKDKNDDRNCIMEIRGSAGGEEAALFAYELYRMYLNYCEHHRLKVEIVDVN